ncbi:MAG TPA: hypothetical protein VGS41_12290 [Chthonomonadales bacterium]|nr:hypothetical protein [Chthonomonadales bacterium]
MNVSFCKRQKIRAIARRNGCTPRTVRKYAGHPELIGNPGKTLPPD